jgi:Sulfotransferase domain
MSGERPLISASNNVVAFTIHKAGSMVLHRVLREICSRNAIKYYSLNKGGEPLPIDRMLEGTDFIAQRNGCFGPIRFFVSSKALPESRIILHLRDPRDVLTSMFFSYCFMHPGEVEANTQYRQEVARAGIDKFVLDMVTDNFQSYAGDYGTGLKFKTYAGNIYDRYARYVQDVVSKPNAILVSYEEMVLSFPTWLRKILLAFELQSLEETYDSVASQHAHTVEPNEEDIWSHKRKVTPGDYKDKLKPETIRELNLKFRDVMDALGYSGAKYESNGIPVPRTRT